MHFGKSHSGRTERVNNRDFSAVDGQRNLGVQVHRLLKMESQVDEVMKKAWGNVSFQGLKHWGCVAAVQNYGKTSIRVLCRILVATREKGLGSNRGSAEVIHQAIAWNGQCSYDERLDMLGLFSPEHSSRRSDVLRPINIMGINRLDSQRLFPRLRESRTRGYRFKVWRETFKGDQMGISFTWRVLVHWTNCQRWWERQRQLQFLKRHLSRYLERK